MNGFTRVALIHVPDRTNVWLRFGHPVQESVRDRHRRVAAFAPGAVFCRVCWEANDYGTTLWRATVLQVGVRGEGVQRLRGVHPGAVVLLHALSARPVKALLELVDRIEQLGIDPAEVAPTYWRMAHNRLAARVLVPPYTRDRHDAYRKREACL